MAEERKGVYVPEKLLSDASLGAQQKLVLAIMISAMDEFNVCRLSSQQIADRLSVTRSRHVRQGVSYVMREE
ncbi:MAG: hypothetical protein J6N32_09765 [Clostridia bacterium]|nr:hypothetical protein [Clostridia bacterium]